jgi:hypothetical protein
MEAKILYSRIHVCWMLYHYELLTQKQNDDSRNWVSLNCMLQALLTKICELWLLKHFLICKMLYEYATFAGYLLPKNSVTHVIQLEKNASCSPNNKD